MRKQIKVLLLVAIVAVLFVMAMIVGSAAVEIYDGEDYVDAKDTLAEAIAAAEEGNTIKLTESVTVDATLVIDKSLNIDGGDFTITSSAADYVFTFSTDGDINLTNINVSAATAGLIGFTMNGTWVLDDVDANVGGVVLIAIGASKTNTFEGAFSLTASDCAWISTAASGNMLSYSKYAINEGEAPAAEEYPVTVSLTNVTITAATTGYIFKLEGCAGTFDSCTVTATSALAFYTDTWGSSFVVKSESAPYESSYSVKGFSYMRGIPGALTIGRVDEWDDVEITATDYIICARKIEVAYNIYCGTFTCTGTNAKGMFHGGIADLAVTINNAIIISNGMPVVGAYAATSATWNFVDCEFEFAGTDSGFMSTENTADVTVNYEYCVFTITAAPADVALFGANNNLGTVIVLAPVGAKLTADKTLDAYVQSVSYGGASYKLASNIEGAFANASVGASLREDLSGLMFATEISKAEIDAIVAEYAVSLADLRFYTLIAPMDYVAKANGIFTKDMLDYALESVATKYVAIRANYSLLGITDGNWDQDATAVSYSGVLTNVKSNTRGYAAVAMIEFEVGGDTVTLYGNFSSVDNARSVAQLTPAA